MFSSLKALFSRWWIYPLYFFLLILQIWIWWHFTDTQIMIGNYGKIHTYSDIALSMITFGLFPLFIFAFVYKSFVFGNTKNREKSGFFGGIIATIISGSSCCGLTLASYFGLVPLMNFLPGSGIEIKIVATGALVYATYITLRDMQSCAVKKK